MAYIRLIRTKKKGNAQMQNGYVSTFALEIALRSCGIKRCEIEAAEFECQGMFYYIRLQTLFLRYEFYVDGNLCVCGVNTEPVSGEFKVRLHSAAKLIAS